MASRLVIITAFALVPLAGCATGIALTDNGRLVHVATDAELPMGCNLIGDIPIGLQADAARPRTEQELVTLMRNKTGDQGGTHVVVDSKEQRGETEEGRRWVGRGRGYSCPATTARPSTPPEEDDDDTVFEDETEDETEGEGEGEGEGEDPGEALDDSDLL